jgi:hypothetical protein
MDKGEELKHSYYLNIIRRILKADFVGWVTYKDVKSLKVVVNKKEHRLPFEGEIRHETYAKFIKELIDNNTPTV